MAQTIQMGEQVSAAPAEAGIPRLVSALDFDADVAEAMAQEGNVAALRVEMAPLLSESTSETDPITISSGYVGPPYRDCLDGWPEVARSSGEGDVIGGGVAATLGSLTVINERMEAPNLRDDGDYFGRVDAWVNDYVWDQKPITLSAVAKRAVSDEVVAGPLTILTARTRRPASSDAERIVIELSDLSEQLRKRVQTVRLKGTGGLEGGPELVGVRPPIIMGSPPNVQGILVTTQPNPTYLVHRDAEGNALQGVSAVYSGSVPIDPGDYVVSLGESNTVEITTSLDATKEVTFDPVGPVAAGSAVADFARYMLDDLGPLGSALIDSNVLSIFRALVPFAAGWRVGQDDTYASVLDALTRPWAWWQPTARGKIAMGLNVDPDLDFIDYRLPQHAILSCDPLPILPPRGAISTAYTKNWHQVGEDGVAGAARTTERGLWAQQPHYRIAESHDPSLAETYPSADTTDRGREDPPSDFVTPFVEASEAAIVHRWIVGLLGPTVKPFRVVCDARALRFEPNRVVAFAWPRFWGGEERAYRILKHRFYVADDGHLLVELVVWRATDLYVLGGDAADEYPANETGDPMRLR